MMPLNRRFPDDQDGDLFGYSTLDRGQETSGDTYALAHHEDRDTTLALAVSENGDARRIIFLPRSKLQGIRELGKTIQAQVGAPVYPAIEVKIPEWLAREKGLI